MKVSQYSRCHWNAGLRHGRCCSFHYHAVPEAGVPIYAFAINCRKT